MLQCSPSFGGDSIFFDIETNCIDTKVNGLNQQIDDAETDRHKKRDSAHFPEFIIFSDLLLSFVDGRKENLIVKIVSHLSIQPVATLTNSFDAQSTAQFTFDDNARKRFDDDPALQGRYCLACYDANPTLDTRMVKVRRGTYVMQHQSIFLYHNQIISVKLYHVLRPKRIRHQVKYRLDDFSVEN